MGAPLTLNIVTSHSYARPSTETIKESFTKRSQRIKARKNVKKEKNKEFEEKFTEFLAERKQKWSGSQKEQTGTDSPGKTPDGGETSAKPKKRKQPDKDRPTSSAKRPKTGVISSLFRHNPAIPQAPQLAVKQLKEDVFSLKSFKEITELHPHMVATLQERLGHSHMTAVQQETIPKILQEKDVLIKSQTGSGKTLAYAVPIVNILQSGRPKTQRSDGTFGIVIVPTRELAIQSLETLQKLVYPFTWIVPGALMGGEKKKSEKSRLRKGLNLIVSTPGRLLDHLQHTNCLDVTKLRWLVIDEADRLLDLGFEKDVSQIIHILDERKEKSRQTVLLSATLTQGVERLAGMSLSNHVVVNITEDSVKQKKSDKLIQSAGISETFSLPQNLRQHFTLVPNKLRLVTLAAFLLGKCKYSTQDNKIIVFLSTQDSVEFHYDLFQNTLSPNPDDSDEEDDEDDDVDDEMELFKLYGDMAQKERSKVFKQFADSSRGVLLCTDVAARGLDVPKVSWIIQYSSPGSPADYIHRVGRTARAGTQGQALLFLTPSEVDYIKVLSDYKISMKEMKMSEILTTLMMPTSQKRVKKGGDQGVEECATSLQMTFETYVNSSTHMMQKARKAFLSYVRGYATYPSHLKHIFHVKGLHLGHVAKAFALREAPAAVSGRIQNTDRRKLEKKLTAKKQRDHPDVFSRPAPSNKKRVISEFGSGFEGITHSVHDAKKKSKPLKKKVKRLNR